MRRSASHHQGSSMRPFQIVLIVIVFFLGILVGMRGSMFGSGGGGEPNNELRGGKDDHHIKALLDLQREHQVKKADSAVRKAEVLSHGAAGKKLSLEDRFGKHDVHATTENHNEGHSETKHSNPEAGGTVVGNDSIDQKPRESLRGITCPPFDMEAINNELQIPLKHLPRKKKTSVAEKYDRRAHNCASNGIWNRVTIDDHHKILHNIVRLGKIEKGSFVLDWGSGCGHSLQFLYEEFKVTGVGIDVSSKTIEYAQHNTTREDLHCVADGTKLEWLPTGKFDHAFSFGSIYHVYNRTKFCHVIRQLVRLVRVGGTVYNGWTENGEYKRDHIKMCLEDLPVAIDIQEERTAFADVKIFPLKAQQTIPNTYSLTVTKKAGDVDDSLYSWERMPIVCGIHKCKKVDDTSVEV